MPSGNGPALPSRLMPADRTQPPEPTGAPAPSFGGLWVPLVTPFRAGSVDHPAAARLVTRLLEDGAAGIVLCGSTGEAAALDEREQLALLDQLLAAVPAARIVMGVAGNHLPSVLARVRALGERPLAGLLVSAPGYVRPAQDGLLAWFCAIADASAVPLLLYDIPARTGAHIARETLLALAAHPRIHGIKDCGGDLAKTLALVADGRLQVLAGEDLQLFGTIASGGVGAITASAHCFTPAFVELIACLRAGELGIARTLFLRLVPWIEAMFAEPNPAPVKAALAAEGVIDASLRLPLTPASAALAARIALLRGPHLQGRLPQPGPALAPLDRGPDR